jgi:phage tail protein X
MDTDFLDWALADFSGYVAADELYDGPFCILSAVDNRRYKRLLYDVLDHDPTHDDIRAFLRRLHTALSARHLALFGVTTDGSALYPVPLVEVFGDVPHQICTLHLVAEVSKAVLGAVASARKGLAATQPKLPRGRPSTQAAKAAARTKKRLAGQGAALFTHRYLFVQRHRNTTERKTLWRVSRGLPQLQTLLPNSLAAFPDAGAAPKAVVCVAGRAPAWSAVVVAYWCWSGQGVSLLRALRAARSRSFDRSCRVASDPPSGFSYRVCTGDFKVPSHLAAGGAHAPSH